MKSNNQPQNREISNYSSLFVSAILLLAVALLTEGTATTPIRQFIEGVLVGMSIACGVIGFTVLIRSRRK